MKNRLSVATVARLMNVSEQFIRMGLQKGIFPFGYAVKMSTQWTYYISPQKLDEAIKHAEDLLNGAQALPPVVPVRKKGKWLNKETSGYHFYGKCSNCGEEFCLDIWYAQNMKFCPNCGTEMENN